MISFFTSPWGIVTICLCGIVLLFVLSILLYRQFFKRFYDIILSGCALIALSPIFLILAGIVAVNLGKPVLFCQLRPGKNGKIFRLHKFRSMTSETDEEGSLLPDDQRMTSFGKKLRNSSLDELPELWDIFRGKMSIVGPRPQLVRDLVFMDENIQKRHNVRPGLTGLAQVSGRNNLTWEERFAYDLQYVENISLFKDLKIILQTVLKVFRRSDISTEGMETSEDYGDYLLRKGEVSEENYLSKLREAKVLQYGYKYKG